jgi:hypothetical protein
MNEREHTELASLLSFYSFDPVALAQRSASEKASTPALSLLLDEAWPLHPGQAAIVEQLVCARATAFIGTKHSFFSTNIHEERAIARKPGVGKPPSAPLRTLLDLLQTPDS